MNKLTPVIVISILTLLSACDSFFKVAVLIDNNSEKEMVVVLDAKRYVIAPFSTQEFSIVKGEHEIAVNQEGEDLFKETMSITSDGLLNFLGNTYVVHRDIYLADGISYDQYSDKIDIQKEIEINGKVYENADLTVYENAVFIDKNWDFNIHEELPSIINNEGADYTIKSKIYYVSDLEKIWGFHDPVDFSDLEEEALQLFLDSLSNKPDSLSQEL